MDGCYCDYDAESPEFFSVSTPKARKDCRCDECGGVIRAGETYRRVNGKWDGLISTYRQCADCRDFEAWAEAHIPCLADCPPPLGMAHKRILEAMSEWDRECPGLYAEAKLKRDDIRKKRRIEQHV